MLSALQIILFYHSISYIHHHRNTRTYLFMDLVQSLCLVSHLFPPDHLLFIEYQYIFYFSIIVEINLKDFFAANYFSGEHFWLQRGEHA